MEVYMWNEEEEIKVQVKALNKEDAGFEPGPFWVIAIARGDDVFKMFLDAKTDIQVLIDLLKTEARKIGAYIDE